MHLKLLAPLSGNDGRGAHPSPLGGEKVPARKVTAGDYRPLEIEAASPPTRQKWRARQPVLTQMGGKTNPTAGRQRVVLYRVPQH